MYYAEAGMENRNTEKSMSFKEALGSAFKKYGTCAGRARRSEFWYFILFNVIINLVLILVPIANIIALIYSLVVIIPSITVSVRRLHDIGKKGTWLFLVLIPVIGAVVLIVWACRDSDNGTNAYGPNPKR